MSICVAFLMVSVHETFSTDLTDKCKLFVLVFYMQFEVIRRFELLATIFLLACNYTLKIDKLIIVTI